jgi:hypothetical protein
MYISVNNKFLRTWMPSNLTLFFQNLEIYSQKPSFHSEE